MCTRTCNNALFFGCAILKSCNNSETEHVLSMVPISAGIVQVNPKWLWSLSQKPSVPWSRSPPRSDCMADFSNTALHISALCVINISSLTSLSLPLPPLCHTQHTHAHARTHIHFFLFNPSRSCCSYIRRKQRGNSPYLYMCLQMFVFVFAKQNTCSVGGSH